MNDLFDQIMFTEATRVASKAIVETGDKYNIDLLPLDNRLALVEMFQLGMQYALKILKEHNE